MEVGPLIDRTRMYLRFATGLHSFLKEPVNPEGCGQVIRQRIADREQNLLDTIKKGIYANADSPYLKLLNMAGCEYGDFKRMVLSDGVEETLCRLYRAGVYLTLDEFKGSRAVVRGSSSFEVAPDGFKVPMRQQILIARSSASRSAGTTSAYDFCHLRNHAMYLSLMLSAADAVYAPLALWWPTLPGGGPKQLMGLTKAGNAPSVWFSQTGKNGTSGVRLRHRLKTCYIVYSGRAFGKRWPMPRYAPLDQPAEIVSWMAGAIEESGSCCLLTYPSSALRICQAAKETGVELSGAKFIIAGEPYTEAKRKEIVSVGAECISFYAFVEAGPVGLGCLNPKSAGEVHFLSDSFAIIQHPRKVPNSGISVNAFLFSSILSSVPRVMLNTESGDYGILENRSCDCEMGKLGLTTHLGMIRGFDKLTAEGMTLVGTDLVRIVEEVLPAKFGGSSTDYQIVEEEDGDGKTRMSVIVSPSVGEVDDGDLVRTVLSGLPGEGITTAMWSYAGTFRVKRTSPIVTGGGKLMLLHMCKRD